ncbi:uracil phosphoribosyltransferase [Lachnoclostridium phytofermentans]|uniref:Uracil phosphoribosyltransferase n=1 Tax=Lachnoclostridium phytofermentans (strain ATCC 700394 / DSM 18823 / ISDg) TaxID=357809 RepID=UPP_LACP7|nr:uracil phosphoribosyltransferase [Lachnoclostridium phytofermentans]A9KIB0.1 RecName: Full=Uracil phosphoribosyltransferase; AltName: Full=UMP pyrophosphorylase; AltName: Full=UPRTase [Lachnoclostridium phytofermentans ISDg]ABX40944.1 uracil phosphoribosyltransferase [Lachnoclostridium phytofermentans ISDg]
MSNVCIMDHPLIQHKIGIMRMKTTSTKEFRDLVAEVAMLIYYEASRNLPLADKEVETPLTKAIVKEIEGKKLCVVPILRAGMHMADGILNLTPNAKVGHIGLYRNEETLEPVEYFCKLPSDAPDREIFVVDPMLATGGSAIAAITLLKRRGIEKIRFLCLIAAPEGLKKLQEAHPDVDVFIGALDERLNEQGYILPGLGDAGDRIYGTK